MSMEPFTVHEGVAAPLILANLDTDTIIRVERMIALPPDKLGAYCFEPLRRLPNGDENPGCILNQPAFRSASILLCGENFGCGSSREAAVWALRSYGVRCIIAPSFGEIFYENCFKNSLLPITCGTDAISQMTELAIDKATNPIFKIDLQNKNIICPSGLEIKFNLDEDKRKSLLLGLDDIDATLAMMDRLAAFDERDRSVRPWIYNFNSQEPS